MLDVKLEMSKQLVSTIDGQATNKEIQLQYFLLQKIRKKRLDNFIGFYSGTYSFTWQRELLGRILDLQ